MNNLRITPWKPLLQSLEGCKWEEVPKECTGAVLTIEMIEELFERLKQPPEERWIFTGTEMGRHLNKILDTDIYDPDIRYQIEIRTWT